jgi:small-conductance mechanosensitive channel
MLGRIASLGAERFIALLLGVFAVVELSSAVHLPVSEEFTLGPGAMPLIYGVGLLIFAAIPAIRPSQKRVSAAPAESQDAPPRDYRAGAITFALLILFIASVYFAGFFIGTAIFSFLYLKIVMRSPLHKAAIFAVIWGGALYYGFDHLLEVQLEPGLLFGG